MQSFMISLIGCSGVMSLLGLSYMAATPVLAERYSAKSRYYAWLVAIIGLIIPFRPQFRSSIVRITPTDMTAPIIEIGNRSLAVGPMNPQVPLDVSSSMSMWQAVTAAWLVGLVVFFAYHLIKHYRFTAVTKRWSEPAADEQALELLKSLKEELGITRQISLKRCLSVGSPMLVGLARPCVLLPTSDFDPDELYFILKHELVHHRRKDLWYKLLVLAAVGLHWFNPVVYLMARSIDALCEMSCDEEVVRGADMNERQRYSEAIIGVVRYRSRMQTPLSTNFYGGVKGMKKRIVSIMDTSQKRAGTAVILAAVLLTTGTGAAFAVNQGAGSIPKSAPESTYIINAAQNGPEQDNDQVKWEPLPEYEQFGISYDGNGNMLFYGQMVRYFWDGCEFEPGMSVTRYDCFNEEGIVDVHTVRSVIDNKDGSFDWFGELIRIEASSQQEFDRRDINQLTGAGGDPVVTAAEGGGFDSGGKTFTEIFARYKDYGIEFTPSLTGGIGNVYHQGRLVKTFVDEKNDGSIFVLSSVDGGDIVVRTVYDAEGNLTGVEVER